MNEIIYIEIILFSVIPQKLFIICFVNDFILTQRVLAGERSDVQRHIRNC